MPEPVPSVPLDRADPGPAGNGASAAAYERLKGEIVRFEIAPGERLVELDICERYGISRTPVRDALRRLEDDGLVERRAKGGRFVRAIDVASYEDVYAVRRVLEGYAVERICAAPERVDLEQLAEAWRAGYPADEVPLDGSYSVADERFHLGLAAATGNDYLVTSMERIHDRLRGIRSVDFTARERIVASEQQHLAIVAAVAAGEGERARRAIDEHIVSSQREIGAILVRVLTRGALRGS